MEVRPGYKQTEIGVIPEDWDVKPLVVIADKIMVGIASAATHAYRVKGIPLFRNQNIKAGYLDDSDLLFVAPEYEVAFKNKRLRGGDLLTMRTGYPGVTAIVPPRYDSAQSFTTLITRPKQNEADSDYLCHFINSEIGQLFFTQSQIGGAQKNVNAGTLRQMPVPLPKIPEQRAIATALSDVDALLGALDRLIAKKRDLKQAAMQQLLTGQTRLPGFHGQWENEELGSRIQALEAGVSVRSSEQPVNADESVVAVLKTSCVGGGKFDPNECKRVTSQDAMRVRLNPRANTILISRMNTVELIGECGFVDKDWPSLFLPDRLWMTSFRPQVKTSAKWLSYVLSSRSYREHLRSIATGTSGSMKNMSKAALLSTGIAFPTFPEQTAIAEVLSDMDAEIAALEQRREKTRALKQGMMQELLTGRVRLTNGEGRIENGE